MHCKSLLGRYLVKTKANYIQVNFVLLILNRFISYTLACSSSPCKYPATCTDGATINDYTCVCTAGYSGTNCDTVAGMLYVHRSTNSVN